MQNAFEFFGLKPSLNLDAKELRSRYLEIQRQGHPDLKGDDSSEINVIELANRFYEELRTSRGVVRSYLLSMEVIDLNQNRLPKDFLFEMMGLNDEIDVSHGARLLAEFFAPGDGRLTWHREVGQDVNSCPVSGQISKGGDQWTPMLSRRFR